MRDVYIIGASCTPFGKLPDKSYKALTREVYCSALEDAQLDGAAVDGAYFGNTTLYRDGQANIGGQVAFMPLVQEGLFPKRAPIVNVENACATSSTALAMAVKDIRSGDSDILAIVGVEKMYLADGARPDAALFMHGIDAFNPEEWISYYERAGEAVGMPFNVSESRSVFMDTYAMQAAWHMKAHGATQRQIAIAAEKTHRMGSLNPLAQYKFTPTADEILADRPVSGPLTRSMCAPIGDGAAALIVASADALRDLPAPVQERAVKIRAIAMTGGFYRELSEPGLSYEAAQRAYQKAGVQPDDIDVAEVHDATSFSEIYQAEMLGFCPIGGGGRLAESGETTREGRIPLNMSGGLVSKGHPIGATGASMIFELTAQLRGEAGERQVRASKLGLAENGGGVMGFDEAVCTVTILEKY